MNNRDKQRRSVNLKLPASIRTIWTSIVTWWDGWLDFEVITLVWFFAQVTVVLGPPATFGLYYVAHAMINDGEALGARGLIQGARKYFWKAMLWGSLNWLAWILAYVNLIFYSQVNSTFGFVAEIMVLVVISLWLVTQFYAVPYFMEQEDKNIFLALRNGILTTLATPFYTLVLMILVVVLIAVSGLFVLPLFLGAPALIAVLGTQAMIDRLISFGKKTADVDPREVR